MSLVILDHDHSVAGFPDSGDFIADGPCSFSTQSPDILKLTEPTVMMIVSLGKEPRRHYLWDVVHVKRVDPAAVGGFRVTGHGFMLNPPQLLQGAAYEEFTNERSKLPEFSDVDHLPFARTLRALACRYHRPGVVDRETREFCDTLCAAVSDDPDMYMYRSRVLEARGDVIGSLADLQTAADLFEGMLDSDEPAAPA